MFDTRIACLSVLAGWAAGAGAQATWADGQVNTTMCYWDQVRGNLSPAAYPDYPR